MTIKAGPVTTIPLVSTVSGKGSGRVPIEAVLGSVERFFPAFIAGLQKERSLPQDTGTSFHSY